MLRRKSTLDRNVLALTLKYSKSHPEIIDGKKIHGRISIKKRAEHDAKLTRLLVEDKKIVGIILDPK